MNGMQTLIGHNVAYLQQARDLVLDLSDSAFRETRAGIHESSIGDHLRHILEHYQAYAAGAPTGRINYDDRARDRALAGDRDVALGVIDTLIGGLRGASGVDAPVDVRLDGGSQREDGEPWSRSTLKRELQYLQAHTVHHYALIAFILRLQERTPPDGFGVAPSTLRHQRAATSQR